jgi:hypothetical protein
MDLASQPAAASVSFPAGSSSHEVNAAKTDSNIVTLSFPVFVFRREQ